MSYRIMFKPEMVGVRWNDMEVCRIHASFLGRGEKGPGAEIQVPGDCDPDDIEAAACCVYGLPTKHPRPSVLDVLKALDAPESAYEALDDALFEQGQFEAAEFLPYLEETRDSLPKTWQAIKHLRVSKELRETPRYPALWNVARNTARMTRDEMLKALKIEKTTETKAELAKKLAAEDEGVEALAKPIREEVCKVYAAARETAKKNKLGEWTLGVAGDLSGMGYGMGYVVHAGLLPPRVQPRSSVEHLTREQAEGYRAALVDLLYDGPPRLASCV